MRGRTVIRVAALLAVLPALAGCAAPRISVVPIRTPPPTTTPTPTPSPVSSQTSAGCSPTAAAQPPGVFAAKTVDVDGDGRRDTEWALIDNGNLRFGVTTASGATISSEQGFAGGGERSFVIGRLRNGVVVAITSEGRDSPVYTLEDCAFTPLRGRDLLPDTNASSPFVLYSATDSGRGGCFDGRLALLHDEHVDSDHDDVIARWVDVSADGRHATVTNTSATIARDVDPATQTKRFEVVSCGSSMVLHPIMRRG